MMRTSRTRNGTTIIEVVMAVIILGVGLPPLLFAFAESSMSSIAPSRATVASFLAIERMEQIIARRYKSNAGYSEITTANFPSETPVTGFAAFNRAVTIAEVDANLNASGSPVGYRQVTVTVSWDSGTEKVVVQRVFADF